MLGHALNIYQTSLFSSDDKANATIEEESDTEFIPEEDEVSSKSPKSKAKKKGGPSLKGLQAKIDRLERGKNFN